MPMTNYTPIIAELIAELASPADACTLICDAFLDSERMPTSPTLLALLAQLDMPTFAPDDAIDADDFLTTEYFDAITLSAMTAFDDPTFYSHAAHIRDTIRDNFEIR